MNNSYNHADFIGMYLDSDDDYEPYGYTGEMLQSVDSSTIDAAPDKSIECILFAPSPGHLFYD